MAPEGLSMKPRDSSHVQPPGENPVGDSLGVCPLGLPFLRPPQEHSAANLQLPSKLITSSVAHIHAPSAPCVQAANLPAFQTHSGRAKGQAAGPLAKASDFPWVTMGSPQQATWRP